MRILHVITSLGTGGAEKLMVDLLPRLRDRGIEVELAVFDGTATNFMRLLEAKGVKVHKFAIGGSVYNPRHIFKLRKLMHGFDMVHTHNTAPQLFAAIASLGLKTKLITTEHNTDNRRRSKPVLKPVDRWMYSRYAKIICISAKAQSNLNQYLPSTTPKSVTINNGIDLSHFIKANPCPDLEGDVKLTMVAAFRPQKDQDTAIRAMQLLPSNFHLYFVGDDERRQALINLVNECGVADRVHFMGVRNDVAEILQASDVAVMSSHYEGLSLSSVEGMACCPMVASDVQGLREVVGGAGLLFEHGNPEDFAKKAKQLTTDKAFYNGVKTKCQAAAMNYDIAQTASNYFDLYSKK